MLSFIVGAKIDKTLIKIHIGHKYEQFSLLALKWKGNGTNFPGSHLNLVHNLIKRTQAFSCFGLKILAKLVRSKINSTARLYLK